MTSPRRVWQHRFEDRSESQLGDALESVDWVIQRLQRDYGEDLYVRPFANGNPTGQDFFVQLKGTDDTDHYRTSDGKWLSYPVELPNLIQWYSFVPPVIFIVWDIVRKMGYWTHIQPFVKNRLKADPTWLENSSGAKEPTRSVRIPTDQIIVENSVDSLKMAIEAEWGKIKHGKNHFEILYEANTYLSGDTLRSELPPVIGQQLKITELQAIVIAQPQEAEGWFTLAAAHYKNGNIVEALQSAA
jgi:hypothetical protein